MNPSRSRAAAPRRRPSGAPLAARAPHHGGTSRRHLAPAACLAGLLTAAALTAQAPPTAVPAPPAPPAPASAPPAAAPAPSAAVPTPSAAALTPAAAALASPASAPIAQAPAPPPPGAANAATAAPPNPAAGAAAAGRGGQRPPAAGRGAPDEAAEDEAAEDEGEALTRTWQASGDAADLRRVERGSTTLFPYGHGRPLLRCAPLRACTIELEAFETLLATASGDSERWLVQTAAAGPGGRTPLVLVKPTACDLSTNLVIATDRRVYELTLDSPPCRESGGARGYNPRLPYTGLLRFYYPEELVRRWADADRAAAAAQANATAAGTAEAPRLAAGLALSQLNFDYRVHRERGFPWLPTQVFDDGEHTYILLPEAARHAAAPALFTTQPDGTLALLNYRPADQVYITDHVLDRAALVLATTDDATRRRPPRLAIENRAAKAPQSHPVTAATEEQP